MNTNTIQLTADNFSQEVLTSNLPVLVDFWAAWCGPCRLMNPIVESLAAEFAGQVKVAKLNVDEFPEIASQYQIHAVPTLLFFQDGKIADTAVGINSEKVLAAKLKTLLNQSKRSTMQAA